MIYCWQTSKRMVLEREVVRYLRITCQGKQRVKIGDTFFPPESALKEEFLRGV